MPLGKLPIPACGVFFIGLVLRLIAWANTSVINPDGALFVHQAKAIYFGQTDTLFCVQSDLTNYPVMIAGAYWLFQDWVFSARFVSFIFGFGTLIPLYLLLKRFLDDQISLLGTLIIAVMPVFVGSSVDLIRDPVLWFFAVLGFYWFTVGWEEENPWFLAWSCLSFLMASWARTEALAIIVCSLLFLTLVRQDGKLKKLACFLLPLLGVAGLVVVVALAAKGFTDSKLLLEQTMAAKLSSPLAPFRAIGEKLAAAAFENRGDSFGFFLNEARKNLWLVAFGTVLNRCLEAFFFPFFLVCALGLATSLKKLRTDQRLQYFALTSSTLLAMLYLHTMRSWYLEYRHICLLIISSIVFIGFGIDRLTQFFLNRLHSQRHLIIVLTALLIVALPLPKNLMNRDADKLVFKEIGEFLSKREGPRNEIPLATSCSNYRVVSFYAHLGYRGAPCPEGSPKTCWEYFSNDFNTFIHHVKENNLKYFLWSEKQWPSGSGNIFQTPYADHLIELGRWQHPDTGEMALYEVR
jgi:hypothetical protein